MLFFLCPVECRVQILFDRLPVLHFCPRLSVFLILFFLLGHQFLNQGSQILYLWQGLQSVSIKTPSFKCWRTGKTRKQSFSQGKSPKKNMMNGDTTIPHPAAQLFIPPGMVTWQMPLLILLRTSRRNKSASMFVRLVARKKTALPTSNQESVKPFSFCSKSHPPANHRSGSLK